MALPLSAFMLYDSFLTMEDEIELVWRRNKSPSLWLFLANRATVVLGIVDFAASSANTAVSFISSRLRNDAHPRLRRELRFLVPAWQQLLMVRPRCINAIALENIYTLLPFVVGAGSWTDPRLPR